MHVVFISVSRDTQSHSVEYKNQLRKDCTSANSPCVSLLPIWMIYFRFCKCFRIGGESTTVLLTGETGAIDFNRNHVTRSVLSRILNGDVFLLTSSEIVLLLPKCTFSTSGICLNMCCKTFQCAKENKGYKSYWCLLNFLRVMELLSLGDVFFLSYQEQVLLDPEHGLPWQ